VKDEEKTIEQLINELVALRQRFAEMEALEVRRKEAKDFFAISKETILNSLMEHVIHQNTEMVVLWANHAAFESVDLTLEELVGRHCYEIWAQRTDPCPDCPVLKAMMTGQYQEVEKTTPDGRAWALKGSPIRDSNGNVIGGIEVTLDITARKLAEDALKKSEARYRHIIEDQTETICRFMPGGILTFVNDSYCRYFGKKREELIGRSFMSLIPEEDRVVVEKSLSLITQENPVATSEHRVTLPDGEIGWQQWINRAIFNNKGEFIEYQSVGRDITERKRMEEALQKYHLILEQRVKERTAELLMKNKQLMEEIEDRGKAERMLQESENKYRTVFETTGTATAILEEDTIISLANEEFEKLSGYSKEEVEGKISWTEFTGEDDLEKIKEYHYLRRLDPNAAPRNYEFTFIDRHGNMKDIFLTVAMISGIKRSVASFLDITEHKRMDRALQESERKYRLIADNVSDIIWTVDMNLRYTYVSPSVTHLLGYGVEEVMGQTVEMVLTPASLDIANKALAEELNMESKSQKDLSRSRALELEHICKDGSTVRVEVKMTFLRDSEGRSVGILGVTRDITDRKRAEDALHESENQLRFLSSQLLTTQENERKRIAQELHDSIGQILTTIKFGVENIVNPIDKGIAPPDVDVKKVRTLILIAQNGIEEIRRICVNLWPSILDDLGILAAISWFCREFQKICPDIHIDKEIDILEHDVPDDLKIVIYRILQESVNNIAKHSNADHIRCSLRKTEGIIELTIEDNGKGFDMKDILYENGSKRGLGLASMKNRAEMSGGSFVVKSIRGKGTTILSSWRVGE